MFYDKFPIVLKGYTNASKFPIVLKGYTNASRTTSANDNKSISGWVFTLGGGVVS